MEFDLMEHGLAVDARETQTICKCGDWNCAYLDTWTQDELDRFWATERFKNQLVVDCTAEGCGKKAGQLCDTPGVWVHIERFHDTKTGGTA